MNVFVKNTFLVVEDENANDASRRNCRRTKTLPQEWKQTLPSAGACSDVSTEYSPRHSIASFSEDESVVVSAESRYVGCCPCTSQGIVPETDTVASALHSLLVAGLPGVSVKIEKSVAEESRRVLICADAQDATLAASRYYQVIHEIKQHLCCSVTYSEGLSLLSARVQKEDYGYSLRSSVACIPEDKADQMCWDVLRKGSCPRRKCCRWYHPQACDVVKFKVVIRCKGAKTQD